MLVKISTFSSWLTVYETNPLGNIDFGINQNFITQNKLDMYIIGIRTLSSYYSEGTIIIIITTKVLKRTL